jgi:RNA polymerase sigma-70 factor (ECF subfamily)
MEKLKNNLNSKEKTLLFNDIYTKYRENIYGHAFKWVKSQETAEDITSQVFMKAYDSLDDYDSTQSSIKTWLYYITKNTVIDRYRKEKKYSDTLSISEYTDEFGRETVIIPDANSRTESYCENRELMKKIKRTIFNMGSANRRVAILSFIRQRSYIDITDAGKYCKEN